MTHKKFKGIDSTTKCNAVYKASSCSPIPLRIISYFYNKYFLKNIIFPLIYTYLTLSFLNDK
jgi:hypothetical protein